MPAVITNQHDRKKKNNFFVIGCPTLCVVIKSKPNLIVTFNKNNIIEQIIL